MAFPTIEYLLTGAFFLGAIIGGLLVERFRKRDLRKELQTGGWIPREEMEWVCDKHNALVREFDQYRQTHP